MLHLTEMTKASFEDIAILHSKIVTGPIVWYKYCMESSKVIFWSRSEEIIEVL